MRSLRRPPPGEVTGCITCFACATWNASGTPKGPVTHRRPSASSFTSRSFESSSPMARRFESAVKKKLGGPGEKGREEEGEEPLGEPPPQPDQRPPKRRREEGAE